MINLLVALPAEARPLISQFGLQRQTPTAYPIYKNDNMMLIVSGVGKAAVAAAVEFLNTFTNPAGKQAWLNIGVAGHQRHLVGHGFLIHQITDASENLRFYPPQVLPVTAQTAPLLTVDVPAADYPGAELVDMEASAFFATACHFSTGELVQCFKVVSDNETSPANKITARGIEKLIDDQMDTIRQVVTALQQLATRLCATEQIPAELEQFQQRWRFTVSQTHQLRQQLRRWQALLPGKSAWSEELDRQTNAKNVLKLLNSQLESLPVQFGAPLP